jgi:hypothetical protein
MSRHNEPNGCVIIVGTILLIALAPIILEVLGFILFMLIAFLAHLFGHL